MWHVASHIPPLQQCYNKNKVTEKNVQPADKGIIKRISIRQIRCFFLLLHYLCRMKTLCIVLGSISLGLGILGIFLPLLPTTPFLLLAAALYFKGSPRLYDWLLNHRHLGPYIRNFRENKAIPLRAKIISLLLMWGTMLYCIFFLIPLLWVKILLALIAAGVSYHILSFKTLR